VWNGAVFQQDWDDFQFSILGPNGLTEIRNANQARIRGIESDITWAATYDFTLIGGVAFYDAELSENYCGRTEDDGTPITDCTPDVPQAPSGTRLPIVAEFKGNMTGRYTFEMGSLASYVQGSLVYEGDRTSDLRTAAADTLGDLPSYTLFDLSFGFGKDNWKVDLFLNNAFDERGEISRFAQCAEAVCGQQVYVVPVQPRTIGVRWSQSF
jgi:outer membrane receptor protein involved in Fe transport